MCDEKATTVEHAPARAFFPEGHRTNLITVPSCEEHNTKTSKDDEYVRNAIVTVAGGNEIAQTLVSDKAKRSFERSPALLKKTFENIICVKHEGEDTIAFELDRARFDGVMHKIACALHYRHTGGWLETETHTIMKQTVTEELEEGGTAYLFGLFEQEGLEWHGENPEVFRYQFVQMGNLPSTFNFEFYEGSNIIVAPDMTDLIDPSTLF